MKPGIKSTEFWVTIILILLIAFESKLGLDLDVEQILGILAMSGIYTAARTAPKVAEAMRKPKEAVNEAS